MKCKILTLKEIINKYDDVKIEYDNVFVSLNYRTGFYIPCKYLGEWLELEPANEMFSHEFKNGKAYRYITNNNDSIWSIFFKKKEELE